MDSNPFKRPTAHVAIEKYKIDNTANKRELVNKAKHNFRIQTSKNELPPMFPERTKDNVILVDAEKYAHTTPDGEVILDQNGEPGEDYNFLRQLDERLGEFNITPRGGKAASVVSVGVLMEVTGGWEKLPEDFDLDKWTEESMQWLKDTWGEENIQHAVLHVDEYTPHIHAMVTPITKDGRLSCRDWIHLHEDLPNMQKNYYEAVKQDGVYPCRTGQKMPFMGHDSQRKAQNALDAAGQIEIISERQPGESDKQFAKRVNEQAQLFSMQKHLELEDAYRKMQAENMKILREKQETDDRLKKEEEEKKKYKEQAQQERKEKDFYAEQLAGSGIPKSALRDSALVAQELIEKHAEEMRIENIKNARLRETRDALREENEELKTENARLRKLLGDYRDAVDKNGISKKVMLNHSNMEDIKYALANGYPKTKEFKAMMLEVKKYGQSIKERKERLEIKKDPGINQGSLINSQTPLHKMSAEDSRYGTR